MNDQEARVLSGKRFGLYDRAFEKWGPDLEFLVLIEEMAELMVRLTHVSRGLEQPETEGLCEELADVLIMCEAIAHHYGLSQHVIVMKLEKLKRLEEGLEEGLERL